MPKFVETYAQNLSDIEDILEITDPTSAEFLELVPSGVSVNAMTEMCNMGLVKDEHEDHIGEINGRCNLAIKNACDAYDAAQMAAVTYNKEEEVDPDNPDTPDDPVDPDNPDDPDTPVV